MTRTTNARIAGSAFLLYIVAGITQMVLLGRATAGEGTAAKLVSIAQHVTYMRIGVLLTLVEALCAFVLAVTLYAITREQDRDIAMLGLICRVAEGITGLFVARSLGLLWLASGEAAGADAGATQLLASFLLRLGAWSPGATLFAMGSALFSFLMLRGRIVPVGLASLGVFASAVLVVLLPLQLVQLASAPITVYMWLPMLAFELTLAMWLLVKGAAQPTRRQST